MSSECAILNGLSTPGIGAFSGLSLLSWKRSCRSSSHQLLSHQSKRLAFQPRQPSSNLSKLKDPKLLAWTSSFSTTHQGKPFAMASRTLRIFVPASPPAETLTFWVAWANEAAPCLPGLCLSVVSSGWRGETSQEWSTLHATAGRVDRSHSQPNRVIIPAWTRPYRTGARFSGTLSLHSPHVGDSITITFQT